jgi:hypothetical protein
MRSGGERHELGIVYSDTLGAPEPVSIQVGRTRAQSPHQYNVAARLSDRTICVYMRRAVLHVSVGPRHVAAQSALLKN